MLDFPLCPVDMDLCNLSLPLLFCFYSGSQGKSLKPLAATNNGESSEKPAVPVKKIVNLNEDRICKNKSCGKTYKEKDNHDAACEYHPGPAVFHDRLRGVCHNFFLLPSFTLFIFNLS